MNWIIICIGLIIIGLIAVLIGAQSGNYTQFACVMSMICIFFAMCIGIPCAIVKSNIEDKHDWYIEIRLKYAEAEGIEKEYLEMNDVATYNQWYKENKADLENLWSFKSASGYEFDYIKVKD
jgi:hypothetical protein